MKYNMPAIVGCHSLPARICVVDWESDSSW